MWSMHACVSKSVSKCGTIMQNDTDLDDKKKVFQMYCDVIYPFH